MIHRFSRSEPEPFVNNSFRSDIEQKHPLIQVHDDESIDHQMAQRLAEEVCNVSGALIDVYVRVDNTNVNATFDEDTNPVYWSPLQIKGYYDPPPPIQELKKWGVDVDARPEVFFPISTINRECGRLLRTGDVLLIPNYEPVLGVDTFRITSCTVEGNYRYKWLYLKCFCAALTNDLSVQPRAKPNNGGSHE